MRYRNSLRHSIGFTGIRAHAWLLGSAMPTKIAIVDDSSTIRKIIRAFIESHTDWKICGEAGDGETAISLVERLKPDLVVLDLSMPVKNGLDAARTISKLSPSSAMVLFTAHASNQLAVESKRVGIGAVIAKDGNSSLEELVRVLRVLGKSLGDHVSAAGTPVLFNPADTRNTD